MKHPRPSGVVVPVVTPVDQEDRVDEHAFRGVLRRLVAAGVHGLFVGGTAGEGPLLTFAEWRRMVQIAHDEVAGKLPLLGGVMDTSARRMAERIEVLDASGYEHFVVAPSFYVALKTPEEHLRLFRECAEVGRRMTMIAYNIPSCTGSAIPPEVVVELARSGTIGSCKESSGDMAYFRRLLAEGRQFGLDLLMGDEGCIEEGLKVGARGVVPVCANVEPETFIRAYEAATKQDWSELARMQARILVLRRNLVAAGACWIAGIKQAVAFLGEGSGKTVSPLEPLTPGQKQKVEAFVRAGRSGG